MLSGSLVSALVLAITLPGQMQRFAPAPMTKIQGRIAAIGQGKVMVTTPAGQSWAVAVTPQTQMHVVGMAEPEALVPGVCIHFLGTVDKKQNRVQEKVDALTIFTLGQTADRMLGASSPDPSMPAPGTIAKEGPPRPQALPQSATAGKTPQIEAFGFDTQGARGKKPAKSKDAGPAFERYDIRGRVISNKAGKITISVPTQYFKPRLTLELAEGAKIAVDSTDGCMAHVGDLFEAVARQLGPGMAEASQVRVELMTRLGSGKKAKKAVAKQSAKKDKEVAAADPQPSAEAKPEAKATPEAAPVAPANPPVDVAKRTADILAAIDLPASDPNSKKASSMSLSGKPAIYCKNEPAKNLEDKFGPPDQKRKVAVQASGATWELWAYGPLLVVVDDSGMTRYYVNQ